MKKITIKITTIVALFSIIIIIIIIDHVNSKDVGGCTANRRHFTTYYKPFGSKYYPLLSSALQIYTSTAVPCNGYLHTWGFLNQNGYVYNLHLAVFRPLKTDNYSSYIVVNTTKLTASRFNEYFHEADLPISLRRVFINVNDKYDFSSGRMDLKRGLWYELVVPEPFRVRRGDVLGFFYGTFPTSQNLLTIPYRPDIANRSEIITSPSYIFLKDDKTLSVPHPDDETARYYMLLNTKVDGAAVAYREPALYARISRRVNKRVSDEVYLSQQQLPLKYFEP